MVLNFKWIFWRARLLWSLWTLLSWYLYIYSIINLEWVVGGGWWPLVSSLPIHIIIYLHLFYEYLSIQLSIYISENLSIHRPSIYLFSVHLSIYLKWKWSVIISWVDDDRMWLNIIIYLSIYIYQSIHLPNTIYQFRMKMTGHYSVGWWWPPATWGL